MYLYPWVSNIFFTSLTRYQSKCLVSIYNNLLDCERRNSIKLGNCQLVKIVHRCSSFTKKSQQIPHFRYCTSPNRQIITLPRLTNPLRINPHTFRTFGQTHHIPMYPSHRTHLGASSSHWFFILLLFTLILTHLLFLGKVVTIGARWSLYTLILIRLLIQNISINTRLTRVCICTCLTRPRTSNAYPNIPRCVCTFRTIHHTWIKIEVVWWMAGYALRGCVHALQAVICATLTCVVVGYCLNRAVTYTLLLVQETYLANIATMTILAVRTPVNTWTTNTIVGIVSQRAQLHTLTIIERTHTTTITMLCITLKTTLLTLQTSPIEEVWTSRALIIALPLKIQPYHTWQTLLLRYTFITRIRTCDTLNTTIIVMRGTCLHTYCGVYASI